MNVVQLPCGVADFERSEVRLNDGQTEELSERETELLRYLAANQGRAVSRETLMDRVWGPGETPSDGAIEYQIHGLRQKLGSQRICTLRGVGYALVSQGA